MLGQQVAKFGGFDHHPKNFIWSIYRWIVVVVSKKNWGEFSPNGNLVFQNRRNLVFLRICSLQISRKKKKTFLLDKNCQILYEVLMGSQKYRRNFKCLYFLFFNCQIILWMSTLDHKFGQGKKNLSCTNDILACRY
jgi:hypothetical protein